ncbi:MAG: AAA family ATPase [Candidatus Lindowbacteria bacterium]|nr:AAA family ATPase [Candidatus Lindowbacteria bacterium]
MTDRRVIAITGKGGTGKTVLATIMARILARDKGLKVLAIDADSAISLPHMLGAKVDKTVSDIREEIIAAPDARKRLLDTHVSATIGSIVKQEAGIHLLVMGRPEGPGCFCAVNDLLRYGIEALSREFEVTIVDGEAGPEQINRRVTESADTLIIVADSSTRSLHTADSIKHIAEAREQKPSRIGLVINRMRSETKAIMPAAQQMCTEILGCIPEDKNITEYDSNGYPIFKLPDSSPSVMAVRNILGNMGL